eukprot:gene6936-7675_t
MDIGTGLFLGTVALSVARSRALSTKAKLSSHHLHPHRQITTTTSTSSKGSFLLKAVDEVSDATKAVNLFHLDKLSGGKNAEIGRSLIAQRNQQVGPNVSVFYKQDGGLVVTSGTGCYMRDVDGHLHLDCCNNVACCGHAHPKVVKAGQEELGKIQTNSRFLNPIQQRYLAKLLATFPSELNTVYMVNSGSEANELALRIARAHTKASRPKDVIVLDSAYHGHSQALVDISPYKWYQAVDGKDYQPPTTHVVSCPDSFRGKYRLGQTEACGAAYAREVEDIVNSSEGGVGVFIAESIVGCGGQVVPPPTYLKRCYEAVRKQGGVCIADEVQTGFARTGTHFWMFERHGVVPDIVTVGKPMGNGYPVAAVICRREVAESFASSGIEYFNTYGGNSVACAIAEAVLDTIHEENLQESAHATGLYLTQRLLELKKYPWVGDVRGVGLFQGIEFIHDLSKTSGEILPYPELTKFVVDFLRYQRVIVSRDGPDENVVKIKPPLVFKHKQVDELVEAMDLALSSATKMNIF